MHDVQSHTERIEGVDMLVVEFTAAEVAAMKFTAERRDKVCELFEQPANRFRNAENCENHTAEWLMIQRLA